MSKKLLVMLCVVMPVVASAQTASDSAAYKRAQMLVNDGNATAGRAIVDSLIANAAAGSRAYAEGLYWRGVLAPTASDAEMDYRRIIVDYPVSPRVEDVLLRLAQLELARADYDGALQHLNRLTLEHPTGTTRARAGYWTARVLFEKNDTQRACAANADALARTSPEDAELRNQINYLNQRCAGVVLTSPSTVQTAAVDSASGATTVTVAPPPAAPVAVPPPAPASKPPMQLPATPRDGKPSIVRDELPAPKPTSIKAPTPVSSSSKSVGYSVQVAAYNVKSQADAMAAKLKNKGYEARVSGTTKPFRVRIGHYATEAQANAVMRSLKAKQINGFVVKAETQ
ncbi:MAG TPA: SPOR domain-containing protein [Gemmatimonadaceae bacterium]|nr:SPOR domain-containing protein [Gemmatimonadaceae bacterium]